MSMLWVVYCFFSRGAGAEGLLWFELIWSLFFRSIYCVGLWFAILRTALLMWIHKPRLVTRNVFHENPTIFGGGGGISERFWLVVSNIFYVHPYLGEWSILTNFFRVGWNHQLGLGVVGWVAWQVHMAIGPMEVEAAQKAAQLLVQWSTIGTWLLYIGDEILPSYMDCMGVSKN